MSHDYLLEKLHNFISGTMLCEDPENAYLLFHMIEDPLSRAALDDEQAREWAAAIKRVGAAKQTDREDERAAKHGAGVVRFATMSRDEKLELCAAVWELASRIQLRREGWR